MEKHANKSTKAELRKEIRYPSLQGEKKEKIRDE
jgi:hypothetical protein